MCGAAQLPNASYVWLPMLPSGTYVWQGYQIVDLPSWRLSDYCNASSA